jgi:putative component of membrane protein insertase Oxa1/YidC/SpoIIIJ protein YidD
MIAIQPMQSQVMIYRVTLAAARMRHCRHLSQCSVQRPKYDEVKCPRLLR